MNAQARKWREKVPFARFASVAVFKYVIENTIVDGASATVGRHPAICMRVKGKALRKKEFACV
jgi:hypothetical protein